MYLYIKSLTIPAIGDEDEVKVVGAPFLASCRGAVRQPPQPPRRPPGDVRADSFGELPAPAAVQAW